MIATPLRSCSTTPPGSPPDPGAGQRNDEKVLALATQLTNEGFQVVRTARATVTSADSRVVDRARADLRSEKVLAALDKAVGDALIELEPDDVSGYGAQYTLELGKRYFK